MRRWIAVGTLWGGCAAPEAGDSDLVAASVDEGGVRACADPGLRTASAFDRKQAEEIPIEGGWDGALIESGGLAADDLDGDGHVDLFVAGQPYVQLHWGQGDGYFEDARTVGKASIEGIDLTHSVGATPVDYDADGDLDLFVTRWLLPNVMLRNEGGRRFSDVTAELGLRGDSLRHQSASWGDLDADGDLDLFVGTYGEFTEIDVNEPVADCSDHVADPSRLYRNDGGVFVDISDRLPAEVHDGYVFASGFYDVDADGYPELFVSNDDGRCAPSVLVDNREGTSFTVDDASRFNPDSHDMGLAVGDLNGDEAPDFALTSWKTLTVLHSSPSPQADNGWVWIRELEGGVTLADSQVYGWGAELGDLDNDGDLDLAAAFGYWSYYDGAGDPLRQPDGLWIQDGDGRFTDRAATFGVQDPGVSRGLLLADLNGDGWLDLTKRILDGMTPMYQSRCGEQGWLRVSLRQPGANPRAIGATVRVEAGGRSLVRWIHSGSTGMYSGQPIEAHFGLGMVDTVDRITVTWPDGLRSVVEGVDARQQVVIRR